MDRLEQLLGAFNLFEALGVVRQEIRHSDFLRFLLDPSKNHALGDSVLKGLLKKALLGHRHPTLGVINIDVADFSDAFAERERYSIDVLVHCQSAKLVVAIENKIGSAEHSDQLGRYKKIIRQEFPDHQAVLLFLSPEGQDPSDEDWLPLSYADLLTVTEGVRKARRTSLGSEVLIAMEHYATMVQRHIVSDSEIGKLCEKLYRAHQEAFDLILEHRPDQQSDIREMLKGVIGEHPGFSLDHSSKAYIRFYPEQWDLDPRLKMGSDWTSSKRILLFELQNSADSVRLKLLIGPGSQEVRESLFEFARTRRESFPGGMQKLYPKWTQVFARSILEKQDYELEFEELVGKAQKQLRAIFASEIKKIVDALGNGFLQLP